MVEIWFMVKDPTRLSTQAFTKALQAALTNKSILKSSNDKIFEVDEAVAKQSMMIKHMNEEPFISSGPILIQNEPPVRVMTNLNLCCQTHYLGINGLLSLAYKFNVDKINREDPEYINKLFKIKPDYTQK
ncbi:hypothetical protein M9H77_07864 [Catharanthus roseus]|uniref:Uncharacterized protein n=1 Tax=Catharanthus roseus TaxID=4058 RepID=A0ACC0BWC7_CATRO|nr:hypothetical protein M9H77_07864 [Catharanthus roseus]